MLRHYVVKNLRCYDVTTVTMLRSYDVTLSRCYAFMIINTLLRPRVDFPYVPNKTRPYFVIKTRYDTEPKAAFIP